jgi:hypothetical protein
MLIEHLRFKFPAAIGAEDLNQALALDLEPGFVLFVLVQGPDFFFIK